MNTNNLNKQQLPEAYETTSLLLRRILGNLRGGEVQIDYIVAQLERRSFGGLFIILGALALVPGISFFVGIAMIGPGIQMLLGYSTPRLPKIIAQKQINVIHLKNLGGKTTQVIESFEQFIKPRWMLLSTKPFHAFIGFLVICLSLAVMLPLPFSNFPGAVALMILSVGLLERDGLMIALGIVAAILGLLISFSIAYVTMTGFLFYLNK